MANVRRDVIFVTWPPQPEDQTRLDSITLPVRQRVISQYIILCMMSAQLDFVTVLPLIVSTIQHTINKPPNTSLTNPAPHACTFGCSTKRGYTLSDIT